MGIEFMICLGLLYLICLLFCWRDLQKNSPSKQYEDQLKDQKQKITHSEQNKA